MSNIIGLRSGNVIVPYTSVTKRTKQVSLTITSNVGGNDWTTAAAVGLAYADSSGSWRLVFNIDGTFASTLTSAKILINGVVFSATGSTSQPVSVLVGGTSPFTGSGQTTQNSTEILGFGAATATAWRFSGDVALASEPTWAAANMEGVIAADVYIAPASAGTAGLVNNVAGNTTGTPILGRTDGAAIGAGYVGEIKESIITGASVPTSANRGDVATLALTAGIWEVSSNAVFNRNGAAFSATFLQISIITATGTGNTGEVIGHNCVFQDSAIPTTFNRFPLSIAPVRAVCDGTNITVAGTTTAGTTLRLKCNVSAYSGATPQIDAVFRAVRIA
jgi:hypothetical protein